MIRLILMAALLFVSGAAMAQKVMEVGGAAIIDNRGLPAGAITTAKKARITDATTSANGTNNTANIASEESNKTVSAYFEVMKADHTTTNWLGAITGCESYDSGDGKGEWRLPTQRELMLIWTLQATLIKKVSGFTELNNNASYWSATGASTPSNAWYVFFKPQVPGPNQTQIQTGLTDDNMLKTSSQTVRCIRDITL